jgi:hypothetical protein
VILDPLRFPGNHRFELVKKLGQGGMGVVYEALDRQLGTRIAVKTLRTLSSDSVLRLKNEFRALQDVHHENLVNLGELFEERGQWFFTMELVEGTDLLSFVRPGYWRTSLATTLDEYHREPCDPSTAAPPTAPDSPSASPPVFEESRLRLALPQIARGLCALHAAGKVHRDIKPSNIMVTRAGRVTILDFGLIAPAGDSDGEDRRRVVGTASHMAPEQALGSPVGPSADWYALGVVLYQALTGSLPFIGAAENVLDVKQRVDPQPPRRLAPETPTDLDELCRLMLARDPSLRPSGQEVLRWLGAAGSPPELGIGAPVGNAAPFVGRSAELAQLHDALEEAEESAVAVVISGESGIGKSALLRRFVDGLDSQVRVLAGRCSERETVPYKAIDGVVDAASRLLSCLSPPDAVLFLPRHIAALAQVFPVLSWIESRTGDASATEVEPRALRTRAVGALRELLLRLASTQRLVVTIEDFQWADVDSLVLLEEVMRPPDPPPLLLVLTIRTAADPEREATSPLPGGMQHRLHLERLPPRDAAALAGQLLREVDSTRGDDADGQDIAAEAAGHPLFIGELVRRAMAIGEKRAPLRLDEALWERVRGLDPAAQQLLELICIAGGPLVPTAAASAAGIGIGELGRLAALLRTGHLLRSTGQALEPYHDRIRTAVLAHLEELRLTDLHNRLASALEAAGGVEPEMLAIHWQGAGDTVAAAGYMERAADEAAHALAFGRAARLYGLALELGRPSGERARRLAVRLGEALANAGRSVEAAEAFHRAAEGAPTEEALELRRRSAQAFLSGGRIDDGIAAIHEVLAAVGLTMHATPRRALISLLAARAKLRLRGLAFTERSESQLEPRVRMRIDATYSVSMTLGAVDTIRGTDFQTRNLLYALSAGEPYRIARALALEASFVALPGPSSAGRVEQLLSRAHELAVRIDHPHALGWERVSRGYVAFLNGKFAEALTRFQEAAQIFRERCRDIAYELDSINLFSLWSLYYLGEVKELVRTLPVQIAEARDRGDLAGLTNLRARAAHVAALAADDPVRAKAEAEDAVRAWSQQGFFAQHYYALYAQSETDLYLGQPVSAAERLAARWRDLKRSLLLRVQFILIEALHLRARTALSVAEQSSGSQQRQWLAGARKDARRIRGLGVPRGAPLSELLLAGVASIEGRKEEANEMLGRAVEGLDALELRLYAAAARRRRGVLKGAEEGRALVQAADKWMAEQQIKNPAHLAAVLAPGFGASSPSTTPHVEAATE